jgi:hypothetical protein
MCCILFLRACTDLHKSAIYYLYFRLRERIMYAGIRSITLLMACFLSFEGRGQSAGRQGWLSGLRLYVIGRPAVGG